MRFYSEYKTNFVLSKRIPTHIIWRRIRNSQAEYRLDELIHGDRPSNVCVENHSVRTTVIYEYCDASLQWCAVIRGVVGGESSEEIWIIRLFARSVIFPTRSPGRKNAVRQRFYSNSVIATMRILSHFRVTRVTLLIIVIRNVSILFEGRGHGHRARVFRLFVCRESDYILIKSRRKRRRAMYTYGPWQLAPDWVKSSIHAFKNCGYL